MCEQCDMCYWSYNLVERYNKSHPCLQCHEKIPAEEGTFFSLRNYDILNSCIKQKYLTEKLYK